MISTVEVRWFLEGVSLDPPILFGDGRPPSTRTDWYARTGPQCGIKLREGNVDVKILDLEVGDLELDGIQGGIQRWRKWTYTGDPSDDAVVPFLGGDDWIAVGKARRLTAFRVRSGMVTQTDSVEGADCHAEWTNLRLEGSNWLTIGLEAYGAGKPLTDIVESVARFILPRLSDGLALRRENSMSYPEWLVRSVGPGDGLS
jgi:hypothetical protein